MIITNNYTSNLSAHIIFVVKYRKQLLIKYGEEIKQLLIKCSHDNTLFTITNVMTNKDHIHIILDHSPTETICNIVKKLKAYTVYNIWSRHEEELSRQFWKKNMFWSGSYYVCSIDQVSKTNIEEYINLQSNKIPIKKLYI